MQLTRLVELHVETAEAVSRLVSQQKQGDESICRVELSLKNLEELHKTEYQRVQGSFDAFSSARTRISRELSSLRVEMRPETKRIWTSSEHSALQAKVQDLRCRLDLHLRTSASSFAIAPPHTTHRFA
jgi:hypothetical protein